MRPALVAAVLLGLTTSALAAPSELFTAAKKGDEKAVAAQIAAKASIDEPNDQGWTPLIIAAYGGHLAVVRQLLEAGADPNRADTSGFTALIQAARFGHLDIVKLLHEHKAKLDARPTGSAYQGTTVLHMAIEDKRDDVVQWLVGKHVDVNAADKNGKTPLMLAAQRPAPELVTLLLGAKADARIGDGDGNDALVFSALSGSAAVAQLLLDAHAPVDAKNKLGMTPLFHAAHGGKTDVVKLFLGHGAKANIREQKFGDTALFRAAQNGHTDVVKLLLDAGAKVDEANDAGETPLMGGAQNGHLPVIELLLQHGAVKDAKDKQGRTAAALAAKSGHTSAAELLEARGATVTPAERSEANADARARWFRDEDFDKCGMLDVKSVGLERCVISSPDKKKRHFELTVRDMSRLEAGDPQKAKHALVGRVVVNVAAGEYIDLQQTANYALSDRVHVVVVPVVVGTPDAFTDGHVELFLYDEEKHRFTSEKPVWSSPACGSGCTAQTVTLSRKGTKVDVQISQRAAAGEHRVAITWDPPSRAFQPRR
jgi:ankyrin repeat protein